jgi:hypothetical protein
MSSATSVRDMAVYLPVAEDFATPESATAYWARVTASAASGALPPFVASALLAHATGHDAVYVHTVRWEPDTAAPAAALLAAGANANASSQVSAATLRALREGEGDSVDEPGYGGTVLHNAARVSRRASDMVLLQRGSGEERGRLCGEASLVCGAGTLLHCVP